MKVLNGKVRHFKYTFFISNIVVERIYRNRFLELWKVASNIPFISLIFLIICFLKYITPISTKKVHLGKPLSHKYDIFVLLITKILLIKINIHGEWQTRSESEPSSLLSEHEVILTSDWLDNPLFIYPVPSFEILSGISSNTCKKDFHILYFICFLLLTIL